MQLDAKLGIVKILEQACAEVRRLNIHLTNGETLTGKVVSVGQDTVVLEALQSRDFFDAVVVVSAIVAVEVQMRTK